MSQDEENRSAFEGFRKLGSPLESTGWAWRGAWERQPVKGEKPLAGGPGAAWAGACSGNAVSMPGRPPLELHVMPSIMLSSRQVRGQAVSMWKQLCYHQLVLNLSDPSFLLMGLFCKRGGDASKALGTALDTC